MNITTVRCKLSEIRVDGGTQPRTGLNESVVQEYAEAMLAGQSFPAMVCFWDGTSRWLASGFHRYFAHQSAGAVEVDVEQRVGTKRDALLYAVGTNYDHGLRLSHDDKRKAVRLVLEDAEWGQWTDRRIAEVTHTSPTFVGKVRASLAPPKPASVHVDTSDDGASVHVDTKPEVRKALREGKEVEVKVKPRAEPEPAADPDDDAGPSAAELLDEMQADLRKAEARVAELEAALKADGKEAVVKLSQRLEHAERRQGELMEDARRWQDRAERYERLLARCGKAVGDRDLDNVAPKVEAMARKLREAKVAA